MVLSLSRRDHNRMYLIRVDTVDVPESPKIPAAQEVLDSSSDVTPCIVMKNDGVQYRQCRRFLLSPFDYDLFAKVKEPLRGTRYNTRDKLIRAIGWAIRNINKDECADDVLRLPNIWQKVINKKGDYIEGT